MKTNAAMMAVLFSVTSFGLGAVTGLRINVARPAAPVASSPVAATPSQTAAPQLALTPDDSEAFDDVDLPPDHPLRTKLNGKRLPLDYAGLAKNQAKQILKDAKVKPLSDGGWLASLGNTLYRLDAKLRIRWRYQAAPPIIDFVIVESSGLIYGIAADEVGFMLEAATGKKLFSEGHNGKAYYSQIVPYGKDGCLIVESLEGYRAGQWHDTQENLEKFGLDDYMSDSVIACRGTKRLWAVDWPPDAELTVKGSALYAVTRTDKSIYVRTLHPSQLKKY